MVKLANEITKSLISMCSQDCCTAEHAFWNFVWDTSSACMSRVQALSEKAQPQK